MGHCHEERGQGGQFWKIKIYNIIGQGFMGLSVSNHLSNSNANPHLQQSNPKSFHFILKDKEKEPSCFNLASAKIKSQN